ncbi:MAG: TetR/AcrR family transcriptional regulator [Bacillota bacterium]
MSVSRKTKYNRLMEKAEELFMKYGYKRVSVDDIAAEAGISKMTIYKYFPSKEDLFTEIMLRMIEKHGKIMEYELKDIASSIDKMEYLFSYGAKAASEYSVILVKDIMEMPFVYEKALAYKKERMMCLWERILKEGIEKGELRKMDLEFISTFLLDLADIFRKPYYLNEEKGMGWMVENLYDLLKYGLLRRKD